jgi:RNA polymerase sigma factor (TIGR02999 family)
VFSHTDKPDARDASEHANRGAHGHANGDPHANGGLTLLLNRMQQGDSAAATAAAEAVYDELHRIASRQIRRERRNHTLEATSLVNEAYLRLVGGQALELRNRAHFFAVASRQMRRVLVDHARAGNAAKRGSGARRITLDVSRDISHAGVSHAVAQTHHIDVVELDEALTALGRVDARAAQVVELRFFGGHSDQEAAETLGVSPNTVRRDWEFARSWLFDHMKSTGPVMKSGSRPDRKN